MFAARIIAALVYTYITCARFVKLISASNREEIFSYAAV